MLPGAPDARADAFEYTLEIEELVPGCAAAGIELVTEVWNNPELPLDRYDAFMIGTTWDYQEKPHEFLMRLAQLEQHGLLLNPLRTVRWNLDKRYLDDMAERGVRTVPTLWFEAPTQQAVDTAFASWDCAGIVIKPVVGAGAWRQVKQMRGEALPAPDALPIGDTMIQPFLPAATDEGEFSYLFFDREFSHCLQKRPKDGDYRVQAMYGGVETRYEPTAAELAAAQAAVDAIEGPLLYARVDLMRDLEGEMALMELELIEPYLYPEQGPDMGERCGRALRRLLSDARANP